MLHRCHPQATFHYALDIILSTLQGRLMPCAEQFVNAKIHVSIQKSVKHCDQGLLTKITFFST